MNGLNMNPVRASRSTAAFTRKELVVVLLAIVFLMALFLPAFAKAKAKAHRIACIGNLKQVGLAYRVFANDHTNAVSLSGAYPFQLSTNSGGTMEFIGTGQAFLQYRAMSNELGSTRVLRCRGDVRRPASDFATIANTNISYFIAVTADETQPQLLLAGDRHLTNDLPVRNGVMELTKNQRVRWTLANHGGSGNVAMSDGSVRQSSETYLNNLIRGIEPNSGWGPKSPLDLTNRLEFP